MGFSYTTLISRDLADIARIGRCDEHQQGSECNEASSISHHNEREKMCEAKEPARKKMGKGRDLEIEADPPAAWRLRTLDVACPQDNKVSSGRFSEGPDTRTIIIDGHARFLCVIRRAKP